MLELSSVKLKEDNISELNKLPNKIATDPPMLKGKDTPLITYATARQMKILGIRFGELKRIKVHNIVNVDSIMELTGKIKASKKVPAEAANEAAESLFSTQYARTIAEQSGHAVTGASIELANLELDQMATVGDLLLDIDLVRAKELLVTNGLDLSDKAYGNFHIFLDVVPWPK